MKVKHNKEFVIFDVETTGLSPAYGDRVVEIAALKISLPLIPIDGGRDFAYDCRRMRPLERFSSLIKVSKEISYGAFAVNGITSGMLKDAPSAEDIYPAFLEFIHECYLIGHNVKFDINFLMSELRLLDLDWHERPLVCLDTIKMARVLLPGLGSYSLWYLARSLGIDEIQRHRAMADVELTHQVFHRLLTIADRKDICKFNELLNLAGKTIRRGQEV